MEQWFLHVKVRGGDIVRVPVAPVAFSEDLDDPDVDELAPCTIRVTPLEPLPPGKILGLFPEENR
jgi:hypothetical protein